MNNSDIAYKYIKENIMNNIFPNKYILDERTLSKILNMSTTPIKIALKELKKEGFVIIKPRKKSYVKPIDLKVVKDIFQIRSLIEYNIVEMTINSVDSKKLINDMRTFREKFENLKDKSGFDDIYDSFRKYFCTNCSNNFMKNQMNITYDHMHRVRRTLFKQTPRRKEAIQEQIDIINYIIKYRNGKNLKVLVEEHINNAKKEFFNNLDNLNL